MLFIYYPRCSTCQKAKKWLDENGFKYDEQHIVEDNPDYDQLKGLYEKSGLPLKRFFNTSGKIYREMQLKDKLPEMSEEEQMKILSTEGMLVKRPIIETEDVVLTGFRQKEWEEKLK
ncbi:MAG: arsenate reductase family protein [Methanobrevibacter ruminantium]|uniref:arsenate reductase family protein n=1 Tax=Methanobrevibacter ruminantium TaxID=83816 RepID=UPI0026EF4045|nr:arsenate reductase family protein [Methanobrevibacter ruminantium]MCI5737576.1 arsenate reductase family protein [Methanobrevibacter ruminantium]MDD6048575.1 arsenate reductase family protein [Methanobrevibacter ruminantium]